MRSSEESVLSDCRCDLSDKLEALLCAARTRAGDEFSGLGVIVSDNIAALPLFPIGPAVELDTGPDAATLLGAISVERSPHHDGFHVLGPDLRVIALSRYFSPPIVDGLKVDRAAPFGGRYLAALFGSMIEGVLVTGIATPGSGVITFANGEEVRRTR